MMKIAVILPAAGRSRRFNHVAGHAGRPAASASKIEASLAGRPVFMRAIDRFLNRPDVGQVILAVPPDAIESFKLKWGDPLGFHGVHLVAGGTRDRWETVAKALRAVDPACTHVAVHDAARPLVGSALIDRVFHAAEDRQAVIPALEVADTLKRVRLVEQPPTTNPPPPDPLDAILPDTQPGLAPVTAVTQTVDRTDLVCVQTPQVFERQLLHRAYQHALSSPDGLNATDDASLVEALGQTVYVVRGQATNFKITHPEDLKLAEWIIQQQEPTDAGLLAKKRLFALDDED